MPATAQPAPWRCVRARAVCLACGRPAFFVPWAPVEPGRTVTLDDMRVVYRNEESCAMAEETLRVAEELERTGRVVYAPGFCAGPYQVLQVWERAGSLERERGVEEERVDLAAEAGAPLAPDLP